MTDGVFEQIANRQAEVPSAARHRYGRRRRCQGQPGGLRRRPEPVHLLFGHLIEPNRLMIRLGSLEPREVQQIADQLGELTSKALDLLSEALRRTRDRGPEPSAAPRPRPGWPRPASSAHERPTTRSRDAWRRPDCVSVMSEMASKTRRSWGKGLAAACRIRGGLPWSKRPSVLILRSASLPDQRLQPVRGHGRQADPAPGSCSAAAGFE